MVLLKAMEQTALKCKDMLEFINAFEAFITNFKEVPYFKEELKYTFINKHLLYECRLKSIKSKQESYFNSAQYRPINSEKCHEQSVYCFWLRYQRFVNDSIVILRCQNPAEALKYNHFNPYHFRSDSLTSNPFLIVKMNDFDKNHQLQPSIRQIERLDELKEEMRKKSSFQSGLWIENESCPSSLSKKRGNNSDRSLDDCFKKENGIANELKGLKGDESSQESDEDAMHISGRKVTDLSPNIEGVHANLHIQKAYGKENLRSDYAGPKNHEGRNASEIVTEQENSKEIRKAEDSILMIRGDHICNLQDLALARKKQFLIQRNLFFDKASRLLNKHLGSVVVGFHSQSKERTMKKMRSIKSKMIVSQRVMSRPVLVRPLHLSLERVSKDTRFSSNEPRVKPGENQTLRPPLKKFDETEINTGSGRHYLWLEQFLQAKKFDFNLNPN